VQSGEIRVAGIALTQNRRGLLALRRDIGMVFQHFNLFPHLTVLENCARAPIQVLGRSAGEACGEALAMLRIDDQAGKYASQLSGGQQQRVAIAHFFGRKSMSRASAYVRVSTNGQTTENQIREIGAAGFRAEPHRVISETISGSVAISARPGFTRLLDRLERGDILIVTKMDRLV
jgi:hypothetical protein